MSDRVTVERKDFDSFLAENQKLIERSQALMSAIDRLEKDNKQLRDELQVSMTRLRALESSMGDMRQSERQSDEALKKARNNIARLIEETDKRIPR
jgi:predicted  nucleic acid-binding Zn-ribbon protein